MSHYLLIIIPIALISYLLGYASACILSAAGDDHEHEIERRADEIIADDLTADEPIPYTITPDHHQP